MIKILKYGLIVAIACLLGTVWLAAMTSWHTALLILAGHGIMGLGMLIAYLAKNWLAYLSLPVALPLYLTASDEAIKYLHITSSAVSALGETFPIVIPLVLMFSGYKVIETILKNQSEKGKVNG